MESFPQVVVGLHATPNYNVRPYFLRNTPRPNKPDPTSRSETGSGALVGVPIRRGVPPQVPSAPGVQPLTVVSSWKFPAFPTFPEKVILAWETIEYAAVKLTVPLPEPLSGAAPPGFVLRTEYEVLLLVSTTVDFTVTLLLIVDAPLPKRVALARAVVGGVGTVAPSSLSVIKICEPAQFELQPAFVTSNVSVFCWGRPPFEGFVTKPTDAVV